MREYKIDIKEHKFQPEEVEIKRYEKIIWQNHDGDTHSVVFVDRSLTNGGEEIKSGEFYEYIFNVPGTHEYFDKHHPKMVGKIKVKEEENG